MTFHRSRDIRILELLLSDEPENNPKKNLAD